MNPNSDYETVYPVPDEASHCVDWISRNYHFSDDETLCFPRRTAYDHYLHYHPNTTIKRASFGRYFMTGVKAQRHTTQYYSGVALETGTDTPLPAELRPKHKEGRLPIVAEEVSRWFPSRYEWTNDENDVVAKQDVYQLFHQDNPNSKAPDFLIGMFLSKETSCSHTSRYWKGMRLLDEQEQREDTKAWNASFGIEEDISSVSGQVEPTPTPTPPPTPPPVPPSPVVNAIKTSLLRELKPLMKECVEGWLNNQKDTLLLQLVGFIEQDKWQKSHEGTMLEPSTKIDPEEMKKSDLNNAHS